MLERFGTHIQAALIAAMALAGALAWLQLPAGALVPLHFSAGGVVDSWGHPALGFFILPLTGLALRGLHSVLPRLDPRGDNLRRSAKAVATIFIAVALVFAVLQAQIISIALGRPGLSTRLPLMLVGALFLVMGNVMGKLRFNFTVGVRTPWTLADERVWDQTHRFAGKAFVAAGLVVLALGLSALDPDWQGGVVGMTTAAAGLAAVLKSWLLWRRRQLGG